MIMSRKYDTPCADPDDSISSFSASSLGSADKHFYQSQLAAEREKSRKLEDKLAGYKTVVQQLPKLQAAITELKKKEDNYKKELAEHKTTNEHLERRLLFIENLLRNNMQGKQGLADLEVCHPVEENLPNTSSSPSFEIIHKSPSGIEIKSSVQMQEVGPGKYVNGEAVINNSSNVKANVQLPFQRRIQQNIPVPSNDLHLPSLKTVTADVTGPPKNLGLHRGFSTNLPAYDDTFNSHAYNKLNSFPAAREGYFSIFSFVDGNKKPARQMEYEAALKESSAEEVARQGTSTQSYRNSPVSFQTSNQATFVAATHTLHQTGVSDLDTRPKEWNPQDLLTFHKKAHNDVKPADSSPVLWESQVPVKTAETSTHNLVLGPGTGISKTNQAHSLNNLNMAGKTVDTQALDAEVTSGDLMKFPSLNTDSPSPLTEQSKSVAGSVYNMQHGTNVQPTSDQSQVTRQIEVTLEEKDSPLGLSHMMYTFAETMKKLEDERNEYKATIERQQSQIQWQEVQIQQFQDFPKLNQRDENVRLREEVSTLKQENDNLLEFIGALKEHKENEIEPGWISVLASQGITDPARAYYPDSPFMKKIESLSVINAKLFQANKDWHNRWEILRQQNEEEKAEMEARVKSLEAANKSLQENVTALEKELQIRNNNMQELMKANNNAEEETSKLQEQNEELSNELISLKTELKDLTRSKKMLESEVTSLKKSSKSRDAQQPGSKDLLTEIGLLKQQLTIFAEDFEKERKDRFLAEAKARKCREERDQIKYSMENKLKKISTQLKAQENDLRNKARQNADLLFQVEDLKLKLRAEQRKASLVLPNSYNNQPPPASYQGPVSMPYSSGLNDHLNNHSIVGAGGHFSANSNNTSAGLTHQRSPEHLPGAWKCTFCTYINYPKRSVCDICGYQNSGVESLPAAESGSGRNELQSRGAERGHRVQDDVVVDTM